MSNIININRNYDNTNKIIIWNSIEEKWRQRWEQLKIFDADPDFEKKKYFITVAYPYPNSPQHIGHGRTYTLADTHARYMRMKGYNVLFPMGFHYTGTPILAMSRRVAAGDREVLEIFSKIYHVSDDIISTFIEPVKIASYFHNEIKLGMKEMGYSIDWRREFTTIDKVYSKFISWQFRMLKKKGLIVQGSYPVGWCPNDQNPVSQHDTIGDIEPEFNEYTLIKFELDDGFSIMPTATLRPETIYGVTNLWVNPKTKYVITQLNDNKNNNKRNRWIVSEEAARKLQFLNYDISIESTLTGKQLVGKYVMDPIRHLSIPVYPASFVDPSSGTGIVMSVPAHAPYDYQALEDLKNDILLQREFGLKDVDKIKPITIIVIESEEAYHYSSSEHAPNIDIVPPAARIIEKFNIKKQDDPQLQKATNEVYSHEFYRGKMLQNTGRFFGMSVSEAKDKIKEEMVASGSADIIFELINKPLRCRCGAECVVKILKDQWFLDYGNKQWKRLAHECIDKMDIIPQDLRQEFNYVVDWLRERACARKSGLGTRIPWDENWIIESLSDSVIYMAYYVLAKYINNKSILNADGNYNNLKDSFFDYVLLGKGNAIQVARDCGLTHSLIEQIRNEFAYFYPVDSRHSGRDLVPNHLSFFIFNHVAIFDKKNWPRQIVVNGSVLMEGKKMSKSLGNIIPLRAAIKEYGADAIRLGMLNSAEILQDADFSLDVLRGIRSKLNDIYNMAIEHLPTCNFSDFKVELEKINELEDQWLISRLQRIIVATTKSMDILRVREALHNILHSFDQDLQWYKKRTRAKNREDSSCVAVILATFLNSRVRMLAPFAPFICEEIWEKISGNINGSAMASTSIIFAGWPIAEQDKENLVAEESELLIMNLLSDIQNIIKVTKIIQTRIVIYTSAYWKQKIYQKILGIILLENKANFGDIMKLLMKDPEIAARAEGDPKLIRRMIEDILSNPVEVRNRQLKVVEFFDESFPINDAKRLLSIETGNSQAQIVVYPEEDQKNNNDNNNANLQQQKKYDPKSKAKYSRPFKPAVYIE
jgi:leucyl-tRNA synthetase